jgi:cell division septal protein FtsQ
MDDHKEIERKEKKTDSSKVGVAIIKYATYLIIFFGILWFLISYVFPMF